MLKFFIAALLFFCPNAIAALIDNDTFTEASATALTSHTPDSGSSWTQSAAGTFSVNASDYLELTVLSSQTRARIEQDIGTPDMVVEASVRVDQNAVNTTRAGIVARVSSDFLDNYVCYLEDDNGTTAGGNADLGLSKRVAGTTTALTTINFNGTLATAYTMRLYTASGFVRCCVSTSCTAWTADADVATGNQGGVYAQGISSQRIDNFKVYPYGRSINDN